MGAAPHRSHPFRNPFEDLQEMKNKIFEVAFYGVLAGLNTSTCGGMLVVGKLPAWVACFVGIFTTVSWFWFVQAYKEATMDLQDEELEDAEEGNENQSQY